jgi:chromosome segregation ATPase
MDVKAAQRELKSCEQYLADIREIMISKESMLIQLKAKRNQIENNLPGLFEKVALGKFTPDKLVKAKNELNDLKRQMVEIPALLKGLNSEEPQYIERISKARQIIDINRGKQDFN